MMVNELSTDQKAALRSSVESAYEGYYETYGKDLIDRISATE